jgi:hypothetical protein
MDEETTNEQAAGDNVGDWMRQAKQNIDEEFGSGYAARNPELVGKMILASSIDNAVTYFQCLLHERLPPVGWYGQTEEIGEEFPDAE